MKFQELNAPTLRGIDRQNTLAIIPIAAVEQHGPHMPTGTDSILCTAVAEAVENRLTSRVLLTPTIWLGASAHHLRLGATLDTKLDTYIETLCDVARSLLEDGFKRILFLNGHGGNIDPMKIAVRRLQPDYLDALLVAGNYWSPADSERPQILEGDQKYVGHACEFETSMMLHVRPELVDQSKMINAGEPVADVIDGLYVSRDMKQRTRDGHTGRPDLATAEKGQRLFEGIVDRLVLTVEKLLLQPLGTTHADFT
jgi:creatinine amidohydrolase